jgi:threonylcarbamoyladenosine tRNA methylthiotransferase MtaB
MAAQPRLCRFLHLPLQYGDDEILQRMGRCHYNCQTYADQAREACRRIPGLCLGTDIIVGFPGETEQNFRRCEDYLASLPFGLMHIFPFSPRQGTPAAGFPDRPPSSTVTERVHRLMALAEAKADAFAAAQLGQVLPVLLETKDGWSDNYLKVKLADGDAMPPNTLVHAKITAVQKGRLLLGHITEPQFQTKGN